MRVTIKIIAIKGLIAFSVTTTPIFSASKCSKPKSNNNFHFSHLLSWGFTAIHRKQEI